LRSGAKPPEARYAYTICSGQTHFHDVLKEDIRCTFRLMWSLLPPPLLLQKTLRIRAHLTTHPGRGRVGSGNVPTRAPPWLRHWLQRYLSYSDGNLGAPMRVKFGTEGPLFHANTAVNRFFLQKGRATVLSYTTLANDQTASTLSTSDVRNVPCTFTVT